MKKMPKVIQIATDIEGLYALTETGQIFTMEVDGKYWMEYETNWCTREEISKLRIKFNEEQAAKMSRRIYEPSER